MVKTMRQLLVALITAAFVMTAVSGLVLAFPATILPLAGLSLLSWRSLHEWSALALTAAVVMHLVLNRRHIAELFMNRSLEQPAIAAALPQQRALAAEPEAEPQETPAVERHPRLSRRRLLIVAGGALAALIAGLAVDRGRPRGSASQAGNSLADFPVLNIESGPPDVGASDWQLVVDGLVATPLRLDRAAWLALPHAQETRDFHCVEGWSVDKLGWSGVRVSELLEQAGPQAQGHFVTFHAYGGSYTDSLTLAEAQAPETLLADSLDGRPLPAAHGGPLRLVIPSQLGYKNVKWVVRLEVTASRAAGYWERTGGYPAEAPVG